MAQEFGLNQGNPDCPQSVVVVGEVPIIRRAISL